jgi:hypothetical protein
MLNRKLWQTIEKMVDKLENKKWYVEVVKSI